jgi:peptidoglycan/LPS O-acetylase OafA/YrhL
LGVSAVQKNFGQILRDHNGAGPGFDFLRLALALAILLAHLAPIGVTRGIIGEVANVFLNLLGYSTMPPLNVGPALIQGTTHAPAVPNMGLNQMGITKPIVLSHVPMFFALSGFLVAGSAFRTKRVFPFLALRFFRIFPALCVEVVLSAILIGSFFTTLPLREYFSSFEFWTYFGNIIGIVQMELPGVIFYNGDVAVNANLWTLPAEFYSYLILSVLMVSALAFNRTLFSVSFLLATAALIIANIGYDYNVGAGLLATDVNVYYFFVGVIFFLWRDHIPYSIWLLIPCVIISYFLMLSPHGTYITPALLAYITVFVGLTNMPKSRLLQSGDYSYGIYLYGFPISIVLAESFPMLRNNFFVLAAFSIICTGVFAFLSWHLVEKRFLKLRKYFSPQSAKIAEERLGEVARDHKGVAKHRPA